jgi:hypothetical protein
MNHASYPRMIMHEMCKIITDFSWELGRKINNIYL